MSKHKTIPQPTRRLIYEKYNRRCAYCGCDLEYKQMQVDHIDAIYTNLDLTQDVTEAEAYDIKEFSIENLYQAGLTSKTDKVKILGNGELKGAFTFKVDAISEKAKSVIEAAGGSVEIVK